MNNSKVKNNLTYIGFILIFCSTLQSFYFKSIGLAPFTIISAVLIFILSLREFYNEPTQSICPNSIVIFIFYLLAFFSSSLSIFYYSDNLEFTRLFGFTLLIFVALFSSALFKYLDIESILRKVLIVHFVYFYIQFLLYFLFQIDLDVVGSITGHGQKGWGGSFSIEGLGHVRRLGGLFNEPGTYSTFIGPLTALFTTFYKNSIKNKLVVYLSLISIMLTFSVFGFIVSSILFLAIIIYFKGKETVVLIFLYSISLSLIVPYIIYRFMQRSSLGLDTGLSFREVFLNQLVEFITNGPYEFLFGTGLLDTDLSNKVQLIGAVNDTSLFLASILSLGFILPTLFFVFLISLNLKRREYFCMLTVLFIFLSKLSLFYVFFPVVLVLTFHTRRLDRSM